mmetsp:Transcript_10265/g.36294  ORF Transcript_10265/g.36294 Transcript_10265/m.36294 type:complete len:558 (+) Transcript_10265:162-1835(+)
MSPCVTVKRAATISQTNLAVAAPEPAAAAEEDELEEEPEEEPEPVAAPEPVYAAPEPVASPPPAVTFVEPAAELIVKPARQKPGTREPREVWDKPNWDKSKGHREEEVVYENAGVIEKDSSPKRFQSFRSGWTMTPVVRNDQYGAFRNESSATDVFHFLPKPGAPGGLLKRPVQRTHSERVMESCLSSHFKEDEEPAAEAAEPSADQEEVVAPDDEEEEDSDDDEEEEETEAAMPAWSKAYKRRSDVRRSSAGFDKDDDADEDLDGWAYALGKLKAAAKADKSVAVAARNLVEDGRLSTDEREAVLQLMKEHDYGTDEFAPRDFASRADADAFLAAVYTLASPQVALRALDAVDEAAVVYDDLLVDESAPLPELAERSEADLRKAVFDALQRIAAEDLDAEVGSFNVATGLFRVDSKIKIDDGSIVCLAVERDFQDFARCRAGFVSKLKHEPGGLALADSLAKMPRKRLKSMMKCRVRNMMRGARAGELKWQKKQLGQLDDWLTSAIDLVIKIKERQTSTKPKFSFCGGFDHVEIEDFFKCFLLQGAFFTGVLTITI